MTRLTPEHFDDESRRYRHRLFEEYLTVYLKNPIRIGESVPHERTRAAKAMIAMVCDPPLGINYVPQIELPPELEEQFMRIRDGAASPTHALEALVGGEAIAALHAAEGRTGRGR